MKIESLLDFITGLESLASEMFKDTNERIYYRGESADYKDNKLLPKVFRTNSKGERIYSEEKEYSRAIRRRPEAFDSKMSRLDILSKMQHFGIPTRLLDFTINPLVALYFACEDSKEDGYVYLTVGKHTNYNIEDNIIANYNSPEIILLSNLPTLTDNEKELYKDVINFQEKVAEDTKIYLEPKPDYHNAIFEEYNYDGNPMDPLSQFGADQFNTFQNVQVKLTSNAIKEYPLITNHEIYPIQLINSYFVKPLLTNENIQRQQGLFYISGLNEKQIIPLKTIKISSKHKKLIRAQLKFYAGIDKSSLFSGLDGIANNDKDKLFAELINSKKYNEE